MSIRKLLFGSATALFAATSAQAADAVVVAEPEPVEYVRVCDVYGTGYYYIPGTETCLKIGGYMRYDIGAGDLFGNVSYDKKDWAEGGDYNENDTYYKRARIQLNLDARTETELGTLRAYAALRFQWDTNQGENAVGPLVETANEFILNQAYIELGGFRVGKTDSLFTTFTDYAGTIINDDFAVPFGPYDTHQISYTFNTDNGFTAAVAIEEGSGAAYTLDDYVPHVVGGVGYTAGWGGVHVVGGYDAVWEEFAVKAKLDVKATEALSLFVMAGYKSAEDVGGVDDAGPNYYGNWGGTWAVWGGGRYVVSPKAAINVQLAYDDFETFSAVANVAYELVPGFTITPEIAYAENFDDSTANAFDDGDFGGFIRFQRNF